MATLPVCFAVFGIGGSELILILAILLLLFGGSKLPSLARGLGQSVREFKKASQDETPEDKAAAAKKPADPAKSNGSN